MKIGASIFAVLWAASLAFPAGAEQVNEFSTPTPPGVAIPDQLKTRLGTLRFFGGFPDAATTEKLYDNLDFQRAVQAYLLALPVVSQAANRDNILTLGPANVTVAIWEKMVDAKTTELTANNNTPYTWFWLDLRDGPIVVEAPPKVLGLADDIWYNWVGDIGVTGPDKGLGGKYLFLPPGYAGAIPQGYFIVRPHSNSVWIAWRSFLVDGDPKPGVDLVKKNLKIYKLGENDPPKFNFVDMSGKPFNMVAPADFRFWEMLAKVVQDEPTDSLDATTLGFWNALGIAKGKPFAPDARMKKIMTEAAEVGDATARAIMYRWRGSDGYWYPDDPKSHWRLGFIGGYKFEDGGARLLDAYSGFFFYATGVTPAMDSKIVGEGSQYMLMFVDSKGNVLDGGKNYKLHLPKDIPVKNFWSVIVYDNQTRSMAQTDQQFPSVSSQTKGLKVNDDGSVDVYFGPKPPAGLESNWAQTVPGRSWNILLRLYGPEKAFFDKSWRPGEIELQH
ncbi:DUF1254 domain-containing protein [Rhodoblastus acidophilus]|uniref:DUF1254 domain-containing protein n=1 Tax=Candidatus Rhodoblastus alkanivorans TaxID=2954117 RepID=A0ABS9Z5V2_9HYPH|nr:DUF1254 domain-containing protein [Candidatus Rhodoblastus alkanivorans]MCI4678628.1 DUF1254 domain-containing protein [Candidatus Rhodoblastus alkanivorans]MCI4683038.1 DUF1254 domain-containing protein [Candidatus Rhodoblastus alkanivorans]MDI4640348.1 DUF1254 domain-containing protein [Rhodoblastus acidophilus]